MSRLSRLLFCINSVSIINPRYLYNFQVQSFQVPTCTANHNLKVNKCNAFGNVFFPVKYSQQSSEIEKRREFYVTTEEFNEAIKRDDILVIDVREPVEVAEGRVPAKKYINIPVKTVSHSLSLSEKVFLEKFGVEKPKFAQSIIFHCRGGVRSSYALHAAQEIGYKNSKHYLGGWAEWSTVYPDKKI